jgi:hypothetical protein
MAPPVPRSSAWRTAPGGGAVITVLRREPAPAILAVAALIGLAMPPPAAVAATMTLCGGGTSPGDPRQPVPPGGACHGICPTRRDDGGDGTRR